ncbi:MAG TPA: GNAT family N-acetyltransferase [Burkholderiales bacterium]|nr:GNAT family N-acetyltransferase [Burkholderiales bacterium]
MRGYSRSFAIARSKPTTSPAADDAVAIQVASSIAHIAPDAWNALAGPQPFVRHEFLNALHETGCASPETGWGPQYLILMDGDALAGAMPLYLKGHSYGEYVFDWSWADAYRRHGLEYYPKLLCAIPFTPVCGPRILAASTEARRILSAGALTLARELGVSSLHCLYPPEEDAAALTGVGMMERHGVQFHWRNDSYASFDDFLAQMNHDKRKKVKQERRKVREAGITFEWREGREIADADWVFFHKCYSRTYREHYSTPYLNLEFFRRIGEAMPENITMVIARRAGKPIAASFNMRDATTLYGRYWGAIEHHPVLHFETCYYQVIEYCIARGLTRFEGGAQGERTKLARGLMPVETRSTHWIARRDFARAIEDFLARETHGVADHIGELNERAPFKELPQSPPPQGEG